MSVAVKEEPGCITYEGYRSQDEAGLFYFRECFADAEALEAHCNSPRMRAFFAQVMPWVVAGPSGRKVRALG